VALLGIDIGGTKLVLTVGDREGTPIQSHRHPTSLSGDWRADLATMAQQSRLLLDEAGVGADNPLERIGISVPGPADSVRGILLNPPNLKNWRNVPIASFFEDEFGAATQIENDANAAALAEAAFGAGRDVSDFVYLTMSTGVGGGVVSDGRLVRGAFGGAGEPGHLPIESPGRVCACGLSGCLEAYVGGNAWRDRLRIEVPAGCRVLEHAGGDRRAVTPEHLVKAAQEGDAFAVEEFARWVDHLARGIVSIVMLLEPARIILGTIAVAAGEDLCFAPLRRRLAASLWEHQAKRLEIVPAMLGDALPQRAGLAVALNGAQRNQAPRESA
jgi:glucokinase